MNKPYLRILSTVVLLTAFTFLALLSTAGTALAQDSNPEQGLPAEFVTVTGNGMTIVQDGWSNNSTPINKFVVTIKNENKITVNYKNPAARLGLTVFAHNDATNGPDFSKSITRKAKNMKRDHDVYVDVSSLPGNIFYVMVGDSLPTAVKIDGSAASAPVDLCGPTSTSMIWRPYLAPESGTGELFNPSRCQWGQIQYVQDHCAEPQIFIEFTSPFPMPVSVSFNGNVIYIGVLIAGEHFFNIDPASINYDDDNYVDTLVEWGQIQEEEVSFIVGNLNPCEPTEEEPEEVPFPGCAHWEDPELVKPAMGELLIGTDSCAWGVIEFIQNPCPGSAVLRVEFESNVPERAHIYFNGVALVEGYLDSGEHVFDVTDLMDEDYNYIDAFIGDDFQAFFMLGEVDICENYSSEDETPKDEDETSKDEDETAKDEDETAKDEDETPEGPLVTDKKETLPTTGGKHQKMLILALAITATGTGLRCTRIG